MLCHSWEDIRSAPWAQPAQHEATLKYFKLCRAKEELERLDIEIQRLQSFIQHEGADLDAVVAKLTMTAPLLAQELQRHRILRSSINDIHIRRLNAIEQLPGFTGIRGSIGQRKGRVGSDGTVVAGFDKGNVESNIVLGDEAGDGSHANSMNEVLDDSDEVAEGLSVVTDFMLSIDS